jgi:predicted nucleic acid-binding protein
VIVVADASPLRYLILSDYAHVLPALYGRVVVPPAVVAELKSRADSRPREELAGGRTRMAARTGSNSSALGLASWPLSRRARAIALAAELSADALLVDDRDARHEADKLGIPVLGTLRVLADAAEHGFGDLAVAFDRLRQTNFRASEHLLQRLLERAAQDRKG